MSNAYWKITLHVHSLLMHGKCVTRLTTIVYKSTSKIHVDMNVYRVHGSNGLMGEW